MNMKKMKLLRKLNLKRRKLKMKFKSNKKFNLLLCAAIPAH